jgi:HipA-like C-terminal domain
MSELADQLRNGVVPAGQLARALGVSPPTLSRRVRAELGRVVVIGRARATRYGLRREVKGLEADIPILRINSAGKTHSAGTLVVLSGRQTTWLPAGEVFEGLPPEVADMQPSGYMGRAFPHQHPDLQLPPRVADWSNDHTLIALAHRGEDVQGNLVLGEGSIERWFSTSPTPVTEKDYPRLAEAAAAGEPAGSSAGGERPKFGAYINGRHTIVKFAPRGDFIAQRWEDLLKLEALALEVLRDGGVAAVEARLVETPTHTFLEINRFDRVGERGRRAMISLAAAYQNPTVSWARAARDLLRWSGISSEDAHRLQLYDAFARLIANQDRHHHNIALLSENDGPGDVTAAQRTRYQLSPAFDQLPTLYAPTNDGLLRDRDFSPPTPTADTWEAWDHAAMLARTYWRRASTYENLSTQMREIASRNSELLDRMPAHGEPTQR